MKDRERKLAFHPLTPDRWADLEKLFGERGAVGGCWCMWWRLRNADFQRNKGAGNRRALKRVVQAGPPPGVLAYDGSEPVGWCAVAPRDTYPRLATSRILKPVDEQPVWSITCLFIARPYRRTGVATELIRAAADLARKHGAKMIEGYPVEPRKAAMPDVFAYTGLLSSFKKAGFEEVARRSEGRPIVRLPTARTRR